MITESQPHYSLSLSKDISTCHGLATRKGEGPPSERSSKTIGKPWKEHRKGFSASKHAKEQVFASLNQRWLLLMGELDDG